MKRSSTTSTPTIHRKGGQALGSSNYLSDVLGEAYQHVEYLPWGETFFEERNTQTDRNPYLYTGKELDLMTGLYYYEQRYYDPNKSTFLGVDPLAEKMPSWGGYTYTFNNPIKYVDPDGKRGVRPARPQARRGGHINNNQIRPSGGYRSFERYNPVSRNNKVNIDYFENTNIPGGSSYTDPVISIGNIRGHRFNAAIEGFRKVIELSSYSVIIRQENRNHGNGKFSEDIDYRFLFDDVEAQNTYLNAQQLYQEEFGVRLRELNESTSLEEGNKNMTNILNIIQVRIEMRKSPEDMLLDDFKQNQEMKFELIDSRTEQIPIIYETVQ